MPVKLLCGNDEYSIYNELKKIRKSVLDESFADLNRKVLVEKLPKQVDIKEVIEAANVGNKCGGCRGDIYQMIDEIKAEFE